MRAFAPRVRPAALAIVPGVRFAGAIGYGRFAMLAPVKNIAELIADDFEAIADWSKDSPFPPSHCPDGLLSPSVDKSRPYQPMPSGGSTQHLRSSCHRFRPQVRFRSTLPS